jgi:hypothetical protein
MRCVDVEQRIAEVCGVINAAQAELVSLIAHVLDTDHWHQWGIRSPEQWVAWHTGCAPERAKQLVALALAQSELPVTFAAFAEGRLSLDQTTVIVKHAPTAFDASACDLVERLTVSQARVTLGRYAWDPDAAEHPDQPKPSGVEEPEPRPEPVERPGSVNRWFTDDGRYKAVIDLPAIDGAIFEQALSERHDALFHERPTGERSEVSWADAVVSMAERSLACVESPSRADRYRVYVHVSPDDAWLNAGPRLPEPVLKRILDDAVTFPAHTNERGVPLSIGRRSRSIPDRLRRFVLDRDRHCRNPMCHQHRHLRLHHIVWWTDGGHTDRSNLAAHCEHCHQAIHRGDITVEGNADHPDGLTYRRRDGTIIETPPPPVPPDKLPHAPAYVRPLGERLQRDMIHFAAASG